MQHTEQQQKMRWTFLKSQRIVTLCIGIGATGWKSESEFELMFDKKNQWYKLKSHLCIEIQFTLTNVKRKIYRILIQQWFFIINFNEILIVHWPCHRAHEMSFKIFYSYTLLELCACILFYSISHISLYIYRCMSDAFNDLTYLAAYRKTVQTTENSIAIHRYDKCHMT